MIRNRSDEEDPAPPRRTPSGAAVMQVAKTEAIERALFEEWATTGYAALSMEAIAKRAGVGKAALYRRWPSKLAMVSDVMTRIGTELIEAPDSGDLRRDLHLLLRQLRRVLRHRTIGLILPDLHAEMPRNPELADAVRATLQVARRDKAKVVFRQAIARGELAADIDLDLAADLVGSMIYWRLVVTRQPADEAYLHTLVDLILRALGYRGRDATG
ncbi:TetR family transcriptional regulator [Kaistia sp. 32K]|uniref:TetR/AcrR family transcriptional regulator n=1 Tax=Kaistia sp. 32K TaxID=2795690 RepID=UPI001916A402|nr:TetR/AcrR family transcriptional regulator [Kaistia sp. 32K]BCP53969.1 TetR family transcriptional regulator [Kaistia sp. 32K]